MKELGAYLKQARESNGVGLEEAADDLNRSVSDIENLEEANIRAFKDVLSMKELVKEYAKYLGLDPDKVVDEFNDFLFEHTSKISLDDILEAQKEIEQKKVISPYTKPPKRPFYYDLNLNTKPLLITLIVVLVILIILFLYVRSVDQKTPVISSELLGNRSDVCEFTY